VRSTAAPYTESRLTHLVRNKCVGFPVVEQIYIFLYDWEFFMIRNFVIYFLSIFLYLLRVQAGNESERQWKG
jgi:hypothetical protein